MKNTDILFVKNIIPPYRIFLFNKLQEIASSRNVSFEVFVMRSTEHGRYWEMDENRLDFHYTIDKWGLYMFIKKIYHLHFNPSLFVKIHRHNYSHIVLGSSWNDINVILISLLKRFGIINSKLSFWSEANYQSLGGSKDNYFKDVIRRFILNSCDSFFVVPGEIARDTIFNKWKIDLKRVIILPNIIDQTNFMIADQQVNVKKVRTTKIIIIVGRLIEIYKGILNFISSIEYNNDFIIKIIGDGPDRNKLEKFVSVRKLKKKVFILGNLNEEKLIKEYSSADIFALPSFSDQNPLSLVEACFMKLPVLVSNRCGNHHELVKSGENGFLIDPYDKKNIAFYFNTIINKDKNELKKMGDKSFKLAAMQFDYEMVLERFVDKYKEYVI
jgi:glycosyltransferase involved in cell wall biosynthesis